MLISTGCLFYFVTLDHGFVWLIFILNLNTQNSRHKLPGSHDLCVIVLDLHKQQGKQWNLNSLVSALFIAKAFQRFFVWPETMIYVQQVFLNSPELFLCSYGMRSKPGAYVPSRSGCVTGSLSTDNVGRIVRELWALIRRSELRNGTGVLDLSDRGWWQGPRERKRIMVARLFL